MKNEKSNALKMPKFQKFGGKNHQQQKVWIFKLTKG